MDEGRGGIFAWLGYRGGPGQLAWVLHRVTGIGVLLFFVIHVVDTMFICYGPELYNKVMALYRLPLFRYGEIALAAALLYHAINGIRITILDFWPELGRKQRALFYAEMVLFTVIFVPGALWMLKSFVKF
ncbi:MAG TPA: succinate dehydrogenase, cytochrome b556 subunit [Candidatus Acidoferrales bacterium]|jgi:succinate dehydrogenase / fumarate reductase cytochrome b subunit